MKAQLNDMAAAVTATLHRKSTSAISRHRNHSHGKGATSTTVAELAAAAAAAVSASSPGASSGNASTNEEMQIYFSKLKQLVPFMPRNRKLSKLEIIQYVIDYICDLQLALESGAAAGGPFQRCAESGLISGSSVGSSVQQQRQPLGVIPNNNTSNGPTCSVQEATLSTSSYHHHPLSHHHPVHDKSPLVDSPVSC